MENYILLGIGLMIQFGINYVMSIKKISILESKNTELQRRLENIEDVKTESRLVKLEISLDNISNILNELKLDIKQLLTK